MTNDLIAAKIETVRRCISRIKERLPDSAEELSRDIDAQDIISINLERAIQACVDIASYKIAETDLPPAQTMGETFSLLAEQGIIPIELAEKMRKAVGFRNISVHDYQSVRWEIVFAICTNSLTDFEKFIKTATEQDNV